MLPTAHVAESYLLTFCTIGSTQWMPYGMAIIVEVLNLLLAAMQFYTFRNPEITGRLCLFSRPAGTTTGYSIPSGFLFNFITCANYTTEILAWLGFNIATQSVAGYLFMLAGAGQMAEWALAKHKRLVKVGVSEGIMGCCLHRTVVYHGSHGLHDVPTQIRIVLLWSSLHGCANSALDFFVLLCCPHTPAHIPTCSSLMERTVALSILAAGS